MTTDAVIRGRFELADGVTGPIRQMLISTRRGTDEMNKHFTRTQQVVDRFGRPLNQASKQASQASRSFTGAAGTVGALGVATRNTTRQGVHPFRAGMQDLTKSTQLALGPLSGVAARITALTALFTMNAAAFATVIASFTGFMVLSKRVVSAGQEFEKQMMTIEAVLTAVGDRAQFTAQEIGDMARELGRATLTSAGEAREAAALLLTFGDIGRDSFEQILTAAQGLSALMGGSLAANTRRLGRLFEDPVSNLDALRRAGIQFSEAQKEQIELFRETGQVAEANAIIMAKLEPAMKAAEEQTGGLAGALDTAKERFGQIFEEASRGANLMPRLTEQVERVISVFERLLADEQTLVAFGNAVAGAAVTITRAIAFVAENFTFLKNVALTGFIALATKQLMPLLVAKSAALMQVHRSARYAALGTDSLIGRTRAYVSNLRRATLATNLMAGALRAIPFVAFATAATVAVNALVAWITRADDASDSIGGLEDRVTSLSTKWKEFGRADIAKTVEDAQRRTRELGREIEELEGIIGTETDMFGMPDTTAMRQNQNRLQALKKELRSLNQVLADKEDLYEELNAQHIKNVGTIGDMSKAYQRLVNSLMPVTRAQNEYNDQLNLVQGQLDTLVEWQRTGNEEQLEAARAAGITVESLRALEAQILRTGVQYRGSLQGMIDGLEQTRQATRNIMDEAAGIRVDVNFQNALREVQALSNEGIALLSEKLGIAGASVEELAEAIARLRDRRGFAEQAKAVNDITVELRRETEALRSGVTAMEKYEARVKLANAQNIEFAEVTNEQVDRLIALEHENTKVRRTFERNARFGQEMGKAITDGFLDAELSAKNFGETVENVLMRIRDIIVEQFVANQLTDVLAGMFTGMAQTQSTSLNTGGGAGGTGGARRVGHTGGIAEHLPRYHGGGIAGLGSNEVPAVLERGEGVFTKEQMANLSPSQSAPTVNVYNYSDSEAEVTTRPTGEVDVVIPGVKRGIQEGKLDREMRDRYGIRVKTRGR